MDTSKWAYVGNIGDVRQVTILGDGRVVYGACLLGREIRTYNSEAEALDGAIAELVEAEVRFKILNRHVDVCTRSAFEPTIAEWYRAELETIQDCLLRNRKEIERLQLRRVGKQYDELRSAFPSPFSLTLRG